ncbi:MAG TPA: trifunctional transcriptional regulator/proline dehydrogenase/L-glutamate gamma-semialdehyde dehydrogenase, partial [Acidiphilium sp.]
GGHGLSGTGPKAGGPLYLRRLLAARPSNSGLPEGAAPRAVMEDLIGWLDRNGFDPADAKRYAASSPLNVSIDFPGPVGEHNWYRLKPRGRVLCRAATRAGLLRQIAAAIATGNRALVWCVESSEGLADLPVSIKKLIVQVENPLDAEAEVALFEGDGAALRAFQTALAARPGPVIAVHAMPSDGLSDWDYPLEFLLSEQSLSINTAAAGGNASLMTIG